MDALFLDANALFSAAYRARAGLRRLWKLSDAEIITSAYAIEEARRNLSEEAQRSRLARLLRSTRIVPEVPEAEYPHLDLGGARLPPKDIPILAAAIGARATHLLTGDVTHFGPSLGRTVAGVLILTPADYLARL